ncbi:hypothetical protein AB0N93_35015 [Streptomyces sp. NPDC091267]
MRRTRSSSMRAVSPGASAFVKANIERVLIAIVGVSVLPIAIEA